MYTIIIRSIQTGEVFRLEDSYTPSLKKKAVVYWQSPKDDRPRRYKIVAWKWQGNVEYKSRRSKLVDIADHFLMSLNFPPDWKDEILKARLKKKHLSNGHTKFRNTI